MTEKRDICREKASSREKSQPVQLPLTFFKLGQNIGETILIFRQPSRLHTYQCRLPDAGNVILPVDNSLPMSTVCWVITSNSGCC